MENDQHNEPTKPTDAEIRHRLGEGWVMCEECGGRLWSYDGEVDIARPCPYRRNGRCEPR